MKIGDMVEIVSYSKFLVQIEYIDNLGIHGTYQCTDGSVSRVIPMGLFKHTENQSVTVVDKKFSIPLSQIKYGQKFTADGIIGPCTKIRMHSNLDSPRKFIYLSVDYTVCGSNEDFYVQLVD